MGGQYTLWTSLAPQPNDSGPVNCLLFINNATLLVSGGDDQVVRLWDVEAGKCLQELRNHRWGQITAFSWLPEQVDIAPVLFIGTGRGVVSMYPFLNTWSQFARQPSTTFPVFRLDDSVEVQALDPLRSKFAVASHSGQIRMFSTRDTRSLHPLWTFQVQDIPRGIFFQGERNDCLVVHTCCLGDVIYCNSETGSLLTRDKLHGGVGSACLSANGRMKVVYNLSSGDFDVYEPADSLIPFSLSVPTETRLIKQCAFAEEDDRTLVCGGDGGTVHIFNLDETQQLESLPAEGPDTFYALTTFSTLDYHFIACGESEEPATIFIWRKTTATRAAEDRRLRKKWQVDRQAAATQSKEKKTRERHRVAGTCQETWQWLWLLAITIAVVGAVSSYILGLGRG